MTDKQINRWLRRRFSPTGWVLLVYYALLNGLSLLAMVWEALRQVRNMDHLGLQQLDPEVLMNNAWGYITAMAVIFLILHAWKGPDYWRGEVFAKEKKMPFGIFCAMVCLCVGIQLVNSLWVMGLEWLCNLNDKSLMPMLEAYGKQNPDLDLRIITPEVFDERYGDDEKEVPGKTIRAQSLPQGCIGFLCHNCKRLQIGCVGYFGAFW